MAEEPQPFDPASENAASLWLAEEWGKQIARALESMTGESALVTFAERELTLAEIDPAAQELLWWEQPLSLGAEAKVWVGAAASSWQEAGNRVLRGAGVEEAGP